MARSSRRRILAPQNDAGVGAAEPFAAAILDTPLPRLHGDVLHDGEIRVRHIGEADFAGPQIAHHIHHRRRRRNGAIIRGALFAIRFGVLAVVVQFEILLLSHSVTDVS